MFDGLFRLITTWINYVSTFASFYYLLTLNYQSHFNMAPRNRFESEYKANFIPHEVSPVLARKPQLQLEQNDQEPPRRGLKKKDDLLKPSKSAMKENRALQYKAGLAPPMKTRDRLRYQSEYKKQFDWKKPLEQEAPILSAEKMIYGVHRDDHPVKASKVKMPKKTEYQLQFVKHPLISSPETRKELLDKHLIEWKEPSVPAGRPSSKPPQPSPPVPKKTMTFQSEYRANFKSPVKYEYVKGAWLGAEHPHILHPDKVPDNENKQEPTSIHPWYQQVIELREKVRIYKARAREGSYFISLLKNLKENGFLVETDDAAEKPRERTGTPSKADPRSPPQNKNRQPSVVTAPDKDDQVKQAEGDEKTKDGGGPPKTKAPPPPLPTTAEKPPQIDHSQKITKRPPDDPTTKTDRQLAYHKKSASENSDNEKDEYLWNRELALPGPSLRKTHSIDTISHESTIASDEQQEPRREAWSEYKPARGLVIPPYGVSSSSATVVASDSQSDIISLSEIDAPFGNEEISPPKEPERPAISRATRKLFTGRRQDPNDKADSFSSDDERSVCSYSSKGSDVLSVEAMEKRRAMASETLQRARRRQAQL
ncbi:nuclear protein MDM1-like [Actinia tenebrosa]|uniref:Nuclear protein MDM1 n=1 Tax=Actinia tenebrosa TaxID=6105 RepID=A0A6P8IDP6_ACTTE|nr:nuclear protein MDM1-like [Actinia tenebrosa]